MKVKILRSWKKIHCNWTVPYSPYPELKVKVKKRKSASHHKKERNSPRNTAHMRQHGKFEYLKSKNWWILKFSALFHRNPNFQKFDISDLFSSFKYVPTLILSSEIVLEYIFIDPMRVSENSFLAARRRAYVHHKIKSMSPQILRTITSNLDNLRAI